MYMYYRTCAVQFSFIATKPDIEVTPTLTLIETSPHAYIYVTRQHVVIFISVRTSLDDTMSIRD